MSRLQKIEAMLSDDPTDPELHYMLAMEHVSLGDDATAVCWFQKLMQLVPNYAPAYHQAGRAFQRLNRCEEARSILKKGIPIAMANGNEHAAGEMQGLLEGLD